MKNISLSSFTSSKASFISLEFISVCKRNVVGIMFAQAPKDLIFLGRLLWW